MQVEGLLRLMFADQAGPAELRAALAATRHSVEQARDEGMDQVRDYLRTGGPFPDRLHIIALMTAFWVDFADLVARWSREAETEAATWPATAGVGIIPGTRALLERIVADADARAAGPQPG